MEDMALELVDVINSGHEDLAREILLQGNYGNINSLPPNRPGAALFCCCIRGYLSLAELLLKLQADVNLRNENMATPLHGAVDNGHQDLVKLLLDHNADVNAQTRRGDTPLHLAAYRGFIHISQCLILARADLTLVNHNSMTPKMEAAAQGHKRLADYIGAVYEVLYPEGYLSDRTCLDSLIHLDPPSQVLFSGRDHHKEQQYQARLQAEQQTKLQGELTSRLQTAQGASLRTLQGYAQGHPFAGQPLLEQESKVCNSSSDFGFPLSRLEAGAWTATPGSSSLHHRQPQQQDESDLCSFQDVHRCLVQRQQLQQQQQQQVHSRQACSDRIELSPQQPSSALTNQHPSSFHHHFHQQQSHPRDHVSFIPIGPGLPADPRSAHQYSTGRLVGYEDLSQSAMASAINELDRKSTFLRVPSLNVNDLSQQNLHILQPAMKFTGHLTGRWSVSIDSPGSSVGDLSSDSGPGSSVNSLLSNFGKGSDFRSMSLNERGETQDPLVRTLIPLHSSFLSSLSPVQQSPGGHGVNKVSRSKSLTCHPVQWSEAKQCSGKPGETGQDRSGKAKSASALDMNEDILRNFVPAGPPPIPPTQELRDTHCSLGLQPLRSGGLTCYGSDTSISGPQPSTKTRLARSESSSPSVGVEGVLPVPINYCLDHENTPAKQLRLTYKPQPDSATRAGTIASQFDGKVHRRGSLDEISKSNVRSSSFCRRFSLAGDSTAEHDNVGACVPYSRIVNNSATHDRRIPSVCRNHSLESDYSSGGISLISTTSDMNSLAPSINSLCDSGTSFGSNAGDGSLTSCHDLPLVTTSAVAHEDPEDNTTKTDLLPPRSLLSAQPRHNCSPSDRSLATETNNNSKTSSNSLLKLNDLSAVSSSHEHQPSESPNSPLIHDSHRSLPPLMTYINIPIN